MLYVYLWGIAGFNEWVFVIADLLALKDAIDEYSDFPERQVVISLQVYRNEYCLNPFVHAKFYISIKFLVSSIVFFKNKKKLY